MEKDWVQNIALYDNAERRVNIPYFSFYKQRVIYVSFSSNYGYYSLTQICISIYIHKAATAINWIAIFFVGKVLLIILSVFISRTSFHFLTIHFCSEIGFSNISINRDLTKAKKKPEFHPYLIEYSQHKTGKHNRN